METIQKTRFHFPINSDLVIEIAVVFMVIAVVYSCSGVTAAQRTDSVRIPDRVRYGERRNSWIHKQRHTNVGLFIRHLKNGVEPQDSSGRHYVSDYHRGAVSGHQRPSKEIRNYADTLTRWRVCHQPFLFRNGG